jgi:hypothetical protein
MQATLSWSSDEWCRRCHHDNRTTTEQEPYAAVIGGNNVRMTKQRSEMLSSAQTLVRSCGIACAHGDGSSKILHLGRGAAGRLSVMRRTRLVLRIFRFRPHVRRFFLFELNPSQDLYAKVLHTHTIFTVWMRDLTVPPAETPTRRTVPDLSSFILSLFIGP